MAKVTGPLFSLDARGRVGDSLIFSKQRGVNYTKKHAIPTNPQTESQGAQRRFIKFITSLWSHLHSDSFSSWNNHPEIDNLSPYHAFLKENTRRWRNHLLPIDHYTASPSNINFIGTHTYTESADTITVRSSSYSYLLKPFFLLSFACTTSHPSPDPRTFLAGCPNPFLDYGNWILEATGPKPSDPITHVYLVVFYNFNGKTPFTEATGP